MLKSETIKLLKELIGEKVFVKCLSTDDYYYNDSLKVEVFTVDDFEYYYESVKIEEIELMEVNIVNSLIGRYYLLTFKDLIFRC